MSTPYDPSPELIRSAGRYRSYSFIFGAIFLALSIASAFFGPADFFHGYLVGFLFWLGIVLGSLAFLMTQYLTGGAWGVVSRRTFEAATRTLPLLALFFVPIAFGLPELYEWARPDRVQHNALLQHRMPYMRPAMVLLRSAIYFGVWITFSFFLNRASAEQDEVPAGRDSTLAKLSAPGLIVYVFTITFAAVDWAESLQTEWYSTIWGFLFVAGEGLAAIAFVIVALWQLGMFEPMARVLRPDHFHDLGKLMLMMVMLWAYFAFSQLLIVWSGNLPHEISYYLPRFRTSWGWLGVALIAGQFLIPFLLLLSVPLKRSAPILASVAIMVLIMHYLNIVWIVLPGYHKEAFHISWPAVTAPLGLGGIWLWAFLRELVKRPLVPVNAIDLEEALVHETE